jgi:cell division protein FtsI (penicillin-binding protein 3)/stage V sporulation protein D (sporulation-specific penicillin-binding protein)
MGVVNMQEVLNNSLNTGAAFVMLTIGSETFSDYMKKLVGQKTGIDLPNEVTPLVDNLDSKRQIEHATASFGQGIAISPINAIRALAAISNGGYLVTPHIVKSIKYEMGITKDVDIPEPQKIFKDETSGKISKMLTVAVDDALLGGTVALPHHSVAAKTGTAQMADDVNGGYFADKYMHTFFGYFPSYDPQFIILLYTMNPRGVQYSSQTLTMPFMEIVKFLINYYQIEPDR